MWVVLCFVLLMVMLAWLVLLSVGVGYVIKKKNISGPQGYVGNQGCTGKMGINGAQGNFGPQGPFGEHGIEGERGFQGKSAAITAMIQDVTFHTQAGMQFGDGTSTAQFQGVVSEVDKLLTLTFSQILITTTMPAQQNFTLSMDLPAGYEMTAAEKPVIAWLGTANNQRQPGSTPAPIYLFDLVKNSSTNLLLRWLPVTGALNVLQNVFLWCNFNVTIQIL